MTCWLTHYFPWWLKLCSDRLWSAFQGQGLRTWVCLYSSCQDVACPYPGHVHDSFVTHGLTCSQHKSFCSWSLIVHHSWLMIWYSWFVLHGLTCSFMPMMFRLFESIDCLTCSWQQHVHATLTPNIPPQCHEAAEEKTRCLPAVHWHVEVEVEVEVGVGDMLTSSCVYCYFAMRDHPVMLPWIEHVVITLLHHVAILSWSCVFLGLSFLVAVSVILICDLWSIMKRPAARLAAPRRPAANVAPKVEAKRKPKAKGAPAGAASLAGEGARLAKASKHDKARCE